MNIEMMALVIAIVSLGVMIVTLFITMRMLMYMKKSDLMKSRNEERLRRKDIMARIESKKKELESMRMMSRLSGSGISQQQIFKLENEISELYSRL